MKRFHILKRNHGLLESKSFTPILLNMSSVLAASDLPAGQRRPAVFMPGTGGWIKNIHGNALRAAMTSWMEQVLHYAPEVKLPEPW